MQPTSTELASPELLLKSLLRAFGLFRRTMEPYFAAFGITPAQWSVLHTLRKAESENAAELRMADLGDRLLIRPPSVTTVVQRCQEMRLLTVQASATDHRAKSISLTDAGRALVARVSAGHEQQIRAVFGCLNEAEQAALATSLSRLADHLGGRLAAAESHHKKHRPIPAAESAAREEH